MGKEQMFPKAGTLRAMLGWPGQASAGREAPGGAGHIVFTGGPKPLRNG